MIQRIERSLITKDFRKGNYYCFFFDDIYIRQLLINSFKNSL